MSEQTSPQTTPPQQGSDAPASKPAVKGFGITEKAAQRIGKLLAERGTPEAALRVAIKGGGCSGLTYVMEWVEKPRERDRVFERDGVKVVIDPKSYLYLMGSELEFVETLMSSGFKIENPKIKAACGCGESFAI
jgi:iron-sulfur cluster assembly protein